VRQDLIQGSEVILFLCSYIIMAHDHATRKPPNVHEFSRLRAGKRRYNDLKRRQQADIEKRKGNKSAATLPAPAGIPPPEKLSVTRPPSGNSEE
jgi:hypothetical protein